MKVGPDPRWPAFLRLQPVAATATRVSTLRTTRAGCSIAFDLVQAVRIASRLGYFI